MATTPPIPEEELSIDDLMNVLRIINTATERNAFKANELSFVGNVYDKYSRFIRAAQQETDATETKPGESD